MTRLVELQIGGPIDPWLALGLVAHDQSTVRIGTVRLHFDAGAVGLAAWVLHDAPEPRSEIDGIATLHGEPSDELPLHHRLAATSIDHVVVRTNDLDRTVAALEVGFGEPCRRVRHLPTGDGTQMSQAFFRLGEIIAEAVGPAGLEPSAPVRPSSLWGLVLTVDDLDAAVSMLGDDLVAPPKAAVQAGRRIATIRQGAGLGLPVALLSPRVR